MAKKIIIANWKMNPPSSKEAEKLFSTIIKSVKSDKTEIVICPPAIYLGNLKKFAKKVALGGQNCFSELAGAYTGEISALMLRDLGVKYVILGHSERRSPGETDEMINKKVKSVLVVGLKPILCVGEKERNDSHEYFNVVKEQINKCLNGIKKNDLAKIIIAYEPVWALSTTKGRRDARPEDAREMAVFIKKVLSDQFGNKTKLPRIIYGGSVNDKNAEDFLRNGGVEGGMPGATSLNAEKFIKIIRIAESIS